MTTNNRIDVYLICNARFHDTNFARLELLKLLAEHEDVMVRVAEDYRDYRSDQPISTLSDLHMQCLSDTRATGRVEAIPDQRQALVCAACHQCIG